MHRLTSVGTHLVQQLHHALPLHGGPLLDGGAAPDAAVLLLDLRGAALGDEGPKMAARGRGCRQEGDKREGRGG